MVASSNAVVAVLLLARCRLSLCQVRLPPPPEDVPAECSGIGEVIVEINTALGHISLNSPTDCDPATACMLGCHDSVEVMPLMERCDSTLQRLLAPETYAALDSRRASCLGSLSPARVLAEVKERVDGGVCHPNLEGVAATTVPQATCADARDRCDAGIASGFVTCANDFCPTCANAGDCDMTCAFCTAATQLPPGGGHRLAQATPVVDTCSAADFATSAQVVTDACCDVGRGACDTSGNPPSECDARCGVEYVNFWHRCNNVLRAAVPAQYRNFERLEHTCATDMPLPPLLALLGGSCYVPPPTTICSDINALYAQVATLNYEGCDATPQVCTARCGAAVLNLVDACGAVLAATLPAATFEAINSRRTSCLNVLTPTEILDELN
eukprot:COSAG02_NODE_13030_length_1457_cov_2.328424_1_plen_384_part_10